jgi:hypothetical protein
MEGSQVGIASNRTQSTSNSLRGVAAQNLKTELEVQLDQSGENPTDGGWTVWTQADREAILHQLDFILASPLIRRSKRYPKFLRHLVEQTLAGNEAELKERLLGVTVFNRSPDYDTNEDTVVRISAGEVRRRLAQFYREPQHAGQLEIDLVPGSYVPVFRRPRSEAEPQAREDGPSGPQQDMVPESFQLNTSSPDASGAGAIEIMVPEKAPDSISAPPARLGRGLARTQRLFAGLGLLLVLAAAAVPATSFLRRAYSPREQLWAPIDASGQVQIVLGDVSAAAFPAEEEVSRCGTCPVTINPGSGTVAFPDIVALSGLAGFLVDRHKKLVVELSTGTSYSDLQHDSIILIGGFNNIWSMRVTDPLRFHFVRKGTDLIIVDRQHADSGAWKSDLPAPNSSLNQDYGLIARVFDDTTGRPVLVVAGLGSSGTIAAANFLQDSDRIAELVSHAPKDWQHHNLEAVVRTQVLDNNPGPPRLVAWYFW